MFSPKVSVSLSYIILYLSSELVKLYVLQPFSLLRCMKHAVLRRFVIKLLIDLGVQEALH